MPRPPKPAAAVSAMPERIYAPVTGARATATARAVPLHVGDTWLSPPPGSRMEDLREEEHPGLHRYAETRGHAPLLDALVEKLRARNALAVERDQVLVTAGATHALACAVGAIADPGEEVLLVAPFWPLIRGIVRSLRAEPVEVPLLHRPLDLAAALSAIEAALTPRTVALYYSNPSNPTGRVLPEAWIEGLAELARRHDLWLLADEVYEDLCYVEPPPSAARIAPERTLTAFSFSKSYGMAGNRVGYLAGPAPLVAQAEKMGVHSAYHAPRAGQIAALRALEGGATWLAGARELYRRAGEDAARRLGLPAPEGSTFLFVDVSAQLDARGVAGFLEDCFAAGVMLAPGYSSGRAYESWVRLCYTSAPPERVAEAVEQVARRLGTSR